MADQLGELSSTGATHLQSPPREFKAESSLLAAFKRESAPAQMAKQIPILKWMRQEWKKGSDAARMLDDLGDYMFKHYGLKTMRATKSQIKRGVVGRRDNNPMSYLEKEKTIIFHPDFEMMTPDEKFTEFAHEVHAFFLIKRYGSKGAIPYYGSVNVGGLMKDFSATHFLDVWLTQGEEGAYQVLKNGFLPGNYRSRSKPGRQKAQHYH
jgi:hypothetical protein